MFPGSSTCFVRLLPLLSIASVPTWSLDVETMQGLIQKEVDSLRPFSLPTFMDLWADDGTICVEGGCSAGKREVEALMEGFDFIASVSCDFIDNCFFLPNINKAACRFSCFSSLKHYPTCVTDAWVGIIVYEWNDAGKIVRIDDFYSEEQFEKSLSPCLLKEGAAYGASNEAAAISGVPNFAGHARPPQGVRDAMGTRQQRKVFENIPSWAAVLAAVLVGFVVGKISSGPTRANYAQVV